MAQAEPQPGKGESMEDILQSIKRIIEDDTAEPAAAAAPDVLDLTQVVQADGTVAPGGAPPLKPATAPPAGDDVMKSIDAALAPPEPTPEPEPEPEPAPAPVEATPPLPAPAPAAIPRKPATLQEGLVSDEAAQAAAAALRPIAESAQKDYSIPRIPSPDLRGGNTVEDLILEALKPMLKAWLDEHLPTIVHKIVEKEVKRIVAFHQD